MAREPSELTVITKTKDLLKYILIVSENSPKKYRFTLTSRLINCVSDALSFLILANESSLVAVSGDYCERKSLQHKALASFKLTDAFAMTARECGCITAKQHENISKMLFDCIRMTGAWMKSDKKRLDNREESPQ
jgi:hypothetical protein